MNMKTWALLAAGLLSLSTLAARAGAPAQLPMQGTLTDADGEPVHGDVQMHFGLFDSATGGEELWSVTKQVPVHRGVYTVYLGDPEPLDLEIFRTHEAVWLSVRVESDAEFPRLRLGSVPFSAFSQHSSHTAGAGISITVDNVISASLGDSIQGDEIDSGEIQRHHLSGQDCETGQVMKWNGTVWECTDPMEFAVPSGAVMMFNLTECPPGWSELAEAQGRVMIGAGPAGTVGGTRGAALGDLEGQAISEPPAHSHPVNPPPATSSGAGTHAHAINDQGHNHTIPGTSLMTGSTLGVVYCHTGNCEGTGTVTIQSASTGITLDPDGAHTHTVETGAFDSGSTGSAAVDVTMPYLQLLACQKD